MPEAASRRDLTNRDRELLRAVAAGRVELSCGSAPDFFVDGVAWCDQFGARGLVRDGLICQQRAGRFGERVSARLTTEGARRAERG